MRLSPTNRRTVGMALSIAIAIVLLAPIAVYVTTFGATVATSHARWGEFGSAMSGIYSVFTAFATLLLLTIQLGLQRKQVDLQRQINQHEYDIAYVQQVRADLEFYIRELHDALSRKLPTGGTVREVLLDRFRPRDEEMLNDSRLLSLAGELDRSERRCIGIWFAVYQGLVGLAGGTGSQFDVNRSAAPLKLIATLRQC